MREHTLKRWLLAACMGLLLPCAADAAGLGRLTILSSLGQPLNAEVELLSVQKGETLTARLSSVETYQRANLPFNAALVGARVTVERRPNGAAYIKVTTPRPVNEPFAELLIEINSEHGRVTRQYTVLLDPPGYGRAAGELPPPPVAAPTVRPPTTVETAPAPAPVPPPAAAAPSAPAEAGAPGPAAARPSGPAPAARRAPRAAAPAPAEAGGRQYGPVKPGETLGGIARSVKPDGVTLEQALVSLYRHNPDAFVRKNMNLVKSGRILTVPEANQMAAVGPREAAREVRVQVADFNAYRGRLADRAGAAPEDGSAASGRISARVARGDAAEPRDTVRLSRGDATGKSGAKGGAADRVRALEEEAVAREKALADANARIAQLEKTIKDMQRLAEMKSGAAPDKAGAVPPPAAKADKSGQVAVAPVITPPAKAPETKSAPPDTAKAPAPPAAAPGQGKGPVPATPGPLAGTAPDAPKGADAAKAEPPAPQAKAEPKPPAALKPKAAPAVEPDLIDTVMDEPLYLIAAAGVLVIGGFALVTVMRRRREGGAADTKFPLTTGATAPTAPEPAAAPAPKRGAAAAAVAGGATVEPLRSVTPRPAPPPAPAKPAAGPSATPSPSPEDNDLDFNAAGRPVTPPRAEPPKRPEPKRVEPAPRTEPSLRPVSPTPAPPRAPEAPSVREPAAQAPEAPRPEPTPRPAAPPPAPPPAPRPSSTGLGAARSLEGGVPQPRVPESPAPKSKPEPAPLDLPDFSLEVPPAGPAGGGTSRAMPASASDMDFNLEPLPPIEVPGDAKQAEPEPAAAAPAAKSTDLDFKLDDISLDFGTRTTPRETPKDDHWYDVQQKFDLAKAYQEMGDRDGARDILKEVVQEGDAEQQAQAKKLLSTLT